MFPMIFWFFFIVPVLVLLLVVTPNLLRGLEKKDICMIALIAVVAIGVCVSVILYWNHKLNNQIHAETQEIQQIKS